MIGVLMTSSHWNSLVLIATLGACGKDAPSPEAKASSHTAAAAATTGARKPCDYVKRADAEKAVGLALPDTNENVTTNECTYQTKEFYGSSVTVGAWESGCDSVVKNESNGHQKKIAGLGDEAFFTREHLVIHKGERCLAVSINGPAPDAEADDGLARVTALALTILPAV
jgi:hypothetical protein